VESLRDASGLELRLCGRRAERVDRLPLGDVDEPELRIRDQGAVQLGGQVSELLAEERIAAPHPSMNASSCPSGTSNALIRITG
jgi:hypothetical protein